MTAAGVAVEVGARAGAAVGLGGPEAPPPPRLARLAELLEEAGVPQAAAALEAASLASNASLREAQGNLDELGLAQSEGETVYLHTIFNELAIAEAPPPPAAGAVAPPPELPPNAAAALQTAQAAVAAQVAAAEAAVAAFVKRAAATPVPDPSIDEGGDPSAIAAQRQMVQYGRRATLNGAKEVVGKLGSDSVKAFAEFCGAAFKATLALEAELQVTGRRCHRHLYHHHHHHYHHRRLTSSTIPLQRLAAPIADDEKPPPSTPGGGAVVVEGGNLSAGGVACGLGAALLAELATLSRAFDGGAKAASAAAASACAGGGDEIEAALTALKSDVDEVGAGLEVDANEVKARIVEGVQLLLPLCSFLAPSIRGAA